MKDKPYKTYEKGASQVIDDNSGLKNVDVPVKTVITAYEVEGQVIF